MVLAGFCDKIVPRMLMAAARLDILPCFSTAAHEPPAKRKALCRQYHHGSNRLKQRGEITQEEFRRIENLAEPGPGSCAMMGTANTMGCMAEAMGMMLPGFATIPAVSAKRMAAGQATGRAILALARQKIMARKLITQKSLENAIIVLMSIGGSTNAIMHLQAIHREAGLGDLSLETFDVFSRRVPQVASVYPASPHDMVDFDEAGGVPAVMKELEGLLHLDCLTAEGGQLGDLLQATGTRHRREVIRDRKNPFPTPEGLRC